MAQLDLLKELLDNPNSSDAVLQFCLDSAGDIICEIRNSDIVEPKYINIQTKIAIEIYNKLGAEGQTSHSENGISRTYETGDISNTLINKIIPIPTTPYCETRVIE